MSQTSVRGSACGQVSRSSPLRRRRLSRGLIATGAINRTTNGIGSDAANLPLQGDGNDNTAQGTALRGLEAKPHPRRPVISCTSPVNDASSVPTPPKPGCSGLIVLACIQNALHMGVITKFSLCPQGKARENLIIKTKATRKRIDWKMSASDQGIEDNVHSRAEEIFLQNTPLRGNDVGSMAEEEQSSGDEDDFDVSILDNVQNLRGGSNPLYSSLNLRSKEPFFVPTGTDISSMGLQGGQVPGMASGKLPFNYRKLRYFDLITASDLAVARHFLRQELNTAKKMRSEALSNHLKKVQRLEKERMKNELTGDVSCKTGSLIQDSERVGDIVDFKSEQTFVASAISRFPHELTPQMSAALLLESLAMNRHESIEGMAKCYDGIVSAGTALLDVANDMMRDGSTNHGGKPKLTTSEIMGALAPLLITTLEQGSGNAIVELSKLRNYCGTRRYQRRFVQRIAPFLVRPPDAAMWCLRHQTDMEPIVAAIEMILDNAFEVFSSGWFERGRNMLKDTQRAETLRTAASQLRRLNSPSPTDGGLLVGLSAPLSQTLRRVGGKKDFTSITHDSLAEWEAMAIDKSIRQSIRGVFSRDWGRISTLNLSPRESETPFSLRQKRGISTAKLKEWQDVTASASGSVSSQVSGLMPASSLTKSPRSLSKLPLSPRNNSSNATISQLPSADALISTFGPSFSSQSVVFEEQARPISPTDYPLPPAPTSPKRDSSAKPVPPKTPPTHHHDDRSEDKILAPKFQDKSSQHSPPSRGAAPLSPQSSVGNASTSSMSTLRSASISQMARDQNRALTSTAAERKRTVAACRALRAQITQFEDAFVRMHGRPPKGAAERAPLASTYMQYREWKRAIRADAACRIQALCRGARVRLTLLQSNDQRISTFVSARSAKLSQPPNHLSIPLDMGGDDADLALTRTRLETRTGQRGEDSVEVEMVPAPSVSPNWRNRQQRHQHQSGETTPGASQSQKSTSSRSRSSLPDVSLMSLAELQQRKRELKQQLKTYDMNFHAQHGRMPEKREKEPIRHLYESYNAYKNQISTIEKGDAQPGPGTAAFRAVTDAQIETSPKAISPTYNCGITSPRQGHFKRSPSASENTDASSAQDERISSLEVSSQDLASLKKEKATLHQMLRSYEKDFFKQHKRQVSSFADIRPVAAEYRRYKEIKKAIAQKSSS